MKPIYRSSHLVNYTSCPKKYYLSTKYPMARTDAMRAGLIFESMLFGFRSEEDKKELIGSKKPATLEPLQSKADQIREIFQFDGKAFTTYQIEFEEYITQGESDFEGDYILNGEGMTGLIDVKFTNSINKNWNYRNSKGEYLQSAMYSMLSYLNKNDSDPTKLLEAPTTTFLYLVVENNSFEKVLYRTIPIIITSEDLIWMWDLIVHIHNARKIDYPAKPGDDLCLGFGAYSSLCPYMDHCEEGRELVTLPNAEVIEFSKLNN